ncbi:Na(+)/H(+) antiporter subunit B [Paenibacillus sp. 1P07SE]|uniref:Na(+)/H(+) antiporter subunit B n=1 Tax=Paenibacillus sp. 1P07SE TaxID=3132209 RepID=UPI0039A552B3
MRYTREHDVMQRVWITVVICLLLAFSWYLFFAGHNRPGGGFIGGLMTASAIVLMYMFFGAKETERVLRLSYPVVISVGLLVAVTVGTIGLLAGDAFITQYFDYVTLPLLGKMELTTAIPFDFGVYLVVVGATMAATVTIAEDED